MNNWHVDDYGHDTYLDGVKARYGVRAENLENIGFAFEPNHARLMAAAPDLLAALRHAVRWHDQLSKEDIAKMEVAIAKAGAA